MTTLSASDYETLALVRETISDQLGAVVAAIDQLHKVRALLDATHYRLKVVIARIEERSRDQENE